MPDFDLVSPYQPTGDQPQAIAALVNGLREGLSHQVLLGATGTGKTFTVANVIAQTQRPTLILAHNKTLAAQLYSEFAAFFPRNAVSYFVSYYDYYQPEAYIPRTDTYIEKTTEVNAEIERMRLAATQSLATRRDVIVVASVSAIYSLGDPVKYHQAHVAFEVGRAISLNRVLRRLVDIYYERNDFDLTYGAFRVRGDTLDIRPAYNDALYRIEFWGDQIERITQLDALTGEVVENLTSVTIHPARHFVAPYDRLDEILVNIDTEMTERVAQLRAEDKLVEAQRLEQRTRYDLEMLREVGYCSGSENYSRHFYGKQSGEPPWTLLDYFPPDYLLVVDESHMTLPQIRGMYHGDRMRKQTLVEYGFRLPSCLDNRPLKFDEWADRIYQAIYTSATPGPYELAQAGQVVEQVIRPTGLLDPEINVRPTAGQIDDLLAEIRRRVEKNQRVLVTTLTKRMAEDLADYLADLSIKVHYLHSEIDTFERVQILQDLRAGAYDVVVGINLLREGLDLPEVSLVAILDADKEGFLRSDTALIQNIGRAARHLEGAVIMYADRVTDSMQRAIDETNRRRVKQLAYNQAQDITPRGVVKALNDMLPHPAANGSTKNAALVESPLTSAETLDLMDELEAEMKHLAETLEFEKAAAIRDRLAVLRSQLEPA